MNTIEQLFGPGNTAANAKKSEALGQEDFLKLLVAQLKNQDPSNPVENGEFLGQIAQFSMVSGIDDLGTSFDGIASSLFATQAMQAAQLVGKEVLVETDVVTHTEGNAVNAVLALDEPAANVKLHVADMSGRVVQTVDLGSLPSGASKLSWNGLDQEGELAPSGDYVLIAEGLVKGSQQALPLQIFSRVESISVDRNNTSVSASLEGDRKIGIAQIREFK